MTVLFVAKGVSMEFVLALIHVLVSIRISVPPVISLTVHKAASMVVHVPLLEYVPALNLIPVLTALKQMSTILFLRFDVLKKSIINARQFTDMSISEIPMPLSLLALKILLSPAQLTVVNPNDFLWEINPLSL